MAFAQIESSNSSLPPDLPIAQTAVERRRRLLTIFFGISMALLLLGSASRWPVHSLVREVLFLAGICLATIGTLGRIWSHLFISGYKTSSLIQSGPYSMCRNPLYFFSAIGMTGIGLCSGTLAVPAIMILFFAIYYPVIIRSEEYRLAAIHLEEFQDYQRSTPAFWPRVSAYNEPETYVIFPRIMLKNIGDAFWFPALAAGVHVIANLHESHVLPSFFVIW